jgi:CheY-like chemotaxis protein
MPLHMNSLDAYIGKKIRALRERFDWPLKTVADHLNISIQQLQRYEQSINKVPASLLFDLAHLFNAPVAWFFEDFAPADPAPQAEHVCQILLVEDDPNDEFLIRKALASFPEPLNIFTLHDGNAVLSFFRKLQANEPTTLPKPDLIFMDLNVPHIRGLELLEDLKKRRSLQNIPVIVLTNSLGTEVIKEAYHQQASGFIRKSFSFEDFQTQLHKALTYWTTAVILPSTSPASA